MDKSVTSAVAAVMSEPEIKGVVCAGKQGLALASAGTASGEVAGFVTSISARASTLEVGKTRPTIVIESTSGKVLIRSNNNVTMAIYK
mmetsp:Transcript_14179/g.34669  ORF Transcript_14179/g.34669 Transcript_14179/m.34669 type:complete len:88 (-) Transcript_14179:221-484(-)